MYRVCLVSFCFLDVYTRIWYGTFLITLAWKDLLMLMSLCTSGVLISMANFWISECSGVTLAEAHTMDALVNVNGVFYSHYLVDGRMALLATLLCGSLSAWPKLESWKLFVLFFVFFKNYLMFYLLSTLFCVSYLHFFFFFF